MASEKQTTEITEKSTNDLFQRYDALSVDDKLALLYYIYEGMGSSVTPAAPEAADPELAQPLIEALYELSEEEQLEAMRSVVRGEHGEISEQYGGLSANNQLLVWYGWAEAMGNRIVDMPGDYQAEGPVQDLLSDLKGMEFESQISLLREAATQMGFSNVTAPPPLAETGVTDSL